MRGTPSPLLLLAGIVLVFLPVATPLSPMLQQSFSDRLNPNVSVAFNDVKFYTSTGLNGYEEVFTDVGFSYLTSGSFDGLDFYITDSSGNLYYDVYFYFMPGTLRLAGVDVSDYTYSMEQVYVFEEPVDLSQGKGEYTLSNYVTYYYNGVEMWREEATIQLSITDSSTYTIETASGKASINTIRITLRLDSPSIESSLGAPITLIDGDYSPDIGVFLDTTLLGSLYLSSPSISGYTPPSTQESTGQNGGGPGEENPAAPPPKPAGEGEAAPSEGGEEDLAAAVAGLAFLGVIAGGIIFLYKRLRKPAKPEYTWEQGPTPPTPDIKPSPQPPPPPRFTVKPLRDRVPVGSTVDFELDIPPDSVPGTLKVLGPGVEKTYRVVSPGAKKISLPAPPRPGTHNYRFTFTRQSVSTEYIVSITAIEAKPKIHVEEKSLSAAPLAVVDIPVEAECPAKCKIRIEAPPALQGLVSPPEAEVSGSQKIIFHVHVGSGVKTGRYTLQVVSEPPTEPVQVELVVAETTTPALVPGYEILRKLGSGGFATVYLARRTSDGSLVALKVPRIELGETISGELMERFKREAETWSKLRHRHIVRLLDHGLKPIPYLAMEYMEGGTLREKLENRGRFTIDEAVELILSLGEALSYAHHLGVVHRDIKPENVLYTGDGTPKLSDWGLVKVMLEASTKSGGGFKGTLLYAAPEQVDPSKYGTPDWRTDIYQLGALLYEVLTGRPPFLGESMLELVNSILTKHPEPPSKLNPACPDGSTR